MKISVSLHNAPKKGEDQNLRQVIFRVREGNNDLKVRTDLMADPTLWDESVPGYRRTTKLGQGGTKAFNDKLQDIFRLIEADFTPMRDGKWLKETIMDTFTQLKNSLSHSHLCLARTTRRTLHLKTLTKAQFLIGS